MSNRMAGWERTVKAPDLTQAMMDRRETGTFAACARADLLDLRAFLKDYGLPGTE